MWRTPAPPFAIAEVAEACAVEISNPSDAAKLRSAIPQMTTNSATYGSQASMGQLWSTTPADYSITQMTDSALKSLYTTRLLGLNTPPRAFYEEIKTQARLRRCPYCNTGFGRTVDHFLPKTNYCSLAIEPLNLVPACYDCNAAMNARVATSAEAELFHAYFEGVDAQWLYATIVPGEIAAAVFTCDPPKHLPEVTRRRIQNQFTTLGLDLAYVDASGGALVEYTLAAKNDYDSGQALAVKLGCLDAALSVDRSGPNGWRAALYRAMAESDWYCSGGFAADGH